MSQAIEKPKPALAMTVGKGIQITTIEEAFRFGQAVVRAGLAPKGDTAEAVVVKLQAGSELGFPPMQALATLTCVNGRIGVMGVGAIALIRRHPDFVQFTTGCDGEGDDRRGYVLTQRRGESAFRIEYRVSDAKRAGLWGKGGPWKDSPDDMLIWRAVSRAAKRYWPDALLGVPLAEELRDIPASYEVAPRAVEASTPDPLLIEEAPVEAEADAVFAGEKPTRCPDCGFPYGSPDETKCSNCGSEAPF
jgi:hypothetical protein